MSSNDEYMGLFLAEMEEQLETLNQCVLALEQSDRDPETINRLFRVAHTLKGSSATMGFELMAELTHRMENLLDDVRNGKIEISESLIDALFACLDQLQSWRDTLAGGSQDLEPAADLLGSLEKLGQSSDASPTSDMSELNLTDTVIANSKAFLAQNWWVGSVNIKIADDCMMKGVRAFLAYNEAKQWGEVLSTSPTADDLSEGACDGNLLMWLAISNRDEIEQFRASLQEIPEITEVSLSAWSDSAEKQKDLSLTAPENSTVVHPGGSSAKAADKNKQSTHGAQKATKADGQGKVSEANEYLRIEANKLDDLMNLLGELVIDRARLTQIESELERKYGAEGTESLGEVSQHISLVSSELQECLLKLRMSPMSLVFGRLPRIVRDLSHQLGKEVNLRLEGEETELDRSVIQNIFEPLIHLIRNSLDHGLETSEERIAQNKPPQGELLIKAEQVGGDILITVKDDGRGIDANLIRQTAVERGVVSASDAKVTSDLEALNWIFQPGFSTRKEVTEVSGRGVGMDVVKHKVEEMHGRIQLESVLGSGTLTSITLPLTLAVIRALLVDVGGDAYTIPLGNVIETLRIPRKDVVQLGVNQAVVVRGKTVSLINLLEWCSSQTQATADDYISIVLVSSGVRQAGLVVSNFIGEQEVVVKPLDKYLGRLQGFSGATLLGDGRVSLIFDIPALLQGVDVFLKRQAG
ncbi:MAG TPA: chemotaxis protein CheA [Desulfobacteria bacterium]|nr:chemotaxis protein CheA [Desulfobacteria bacterium]